MAQIQLSLMKAETHHLKMLKKVDDTVPNKNKTKNNSSKPITKAKAKRQSKKTLKLLPGQQILTFKPNISHNKQKNFQFLCIQEKSMGWPEQFSNKLITHDYDNDQESNQHLVKKEVQKGVATLVQEITFKRILQMEDTIGF